VNIVIRGLALIPRAYDELPKSDLGHLFNQVPSAGFTQGDKSTLLIVYSNKKINTSFNIILKTMNIL